MTRYGMNPFEHADFIRVEYDAETRDYWLYVQNINCNTQIVTGSAVATALVMKANNVRHFDWGNSTFDNEAAYRAFLDGAAAVGFDV